MDLSTYQSLVYFDIFCPYVQCRISEIWDYHNPAGNLQDTQPTIMYYENIIGNRMALIPQCPVTHFFWLSPQSGNP